MIDDLIKPQGSVLDVDSADEADEWLVFRGGKCKNRSLPVENGPTTKMSLGDRFFPDTFPRKWPIITMTQRLGAVQHTRGGDGRI